MELIIVAMELFACQGSHNVGLVKIIHQVEFVLLLLLFTFRTYIFKHLRKRMIFMTRYLH